MNGTWRPLLALLLIGQGILLFAQEGTLDPTFNPDDVGFGFGDGANYSILTTCVQSDGKVIVGGKFTTYYGSPKNRLVRLNGDGSIDASFDQGSGSNGDLYCTAIQSDGRIIIGGFFSSFNGTPRSNVVRLNADGSLDPSFDPGSGADSLVRCITLQTDGKIIVAGSFRHFNGAVRNYITRLNADGSLDPLFNTGSGANAEIFSHALQADGKIIIGGNFTVCGGASRTSIARLNADGALDAGFIPGLGAPGGIRTVVVQPDAKIIIGGNFTSYSGIAINRIARLNTNGSRDNSFNPGSGANGPIETSALQPDGKIIIGGQFTTFNGTARPDLARLNSNAGLDASFDPGYDISIPVKTAAIQSDGKIICGGANGSTPNTVQRLNADGGLDTSFRIGSGVNGFIRPSAMQPDGKFILAGGFTRYNSASRNRIARANSDGTLDVSFNPGWGASGLVNTIALQPDGRILIGGDFLGYNGSARNRIVRLNTNGGLDTSFHIGSGANSYIYTSALQADGKVIIGGIFTAYNGTPRNTIARLNADGSLDGSFIPGSGANDAVYSITVQPDGKVIIGGWFTSYNGTPRAHIARLNADGSLDGSFDPGVYGADASLQCTALQPDGKILIGGSFSHYYGASRNAIARLNADGSNDASFNPGSGANGAVSFILLQPDGKIIIVGWFTSFNGIQRNGIARLNVNGSVDASFAMGSGANQGVYAAALQSDGKIIIGGDLTSYNGTGRNRIARINGTPRAGIKVMLEGPYSGGTMSDALRTLPSFPLTEPFTAMGYSETGFTSGATIGSSVLSTTGNNAIVDWVLVEMRPVATPGTVAASRAVLLQRDGDVVDLDGVSTVGFAGLAAGNYCVAVKPRNHLPVMLSATTPVSYGAAVATVDFTLPTTQVYDSDARKNVSGVMVLAAGDVSFNETVQYTGSGNDRDPILTRVGSTTPNNSVNGYWREDVNMDGVVKYTGLANDRDIILTNVGSTTPNNTRVATLP